MKGKQEESIGFVVTGKVKLAEQESSEVTGESTSLLNSAGTGNNVVIVPAKYENSQLLREDCDQAEVPALKTTTATGERFSRQMKILLICCTANFLSLCCVSLQAPFYPKTVCRKFFLSAVVSV